MAKDKYFVRAQDISLLEFGTRLNFEKHGGLSEASCLAENHQKQQVKDRVISARSFTEPLLLNLAYFLSDRADAEIRIKS